MIINEAISRLQIKLNRGVPSDDSRYSDEFLYSLLKTMRSKRLRQKLDQSVYLSDFNYNTIPCLPLELGHFSDCPCFTDDCFILRSTVQLPKIMSFRTSIAVKYVTTIDGQTLTHTSFSANKYDKHRKVQATDDNLRYFIHNNYLYVVGSTTLKVVTLTAIFEDPLELNGINACDTEGNPIPGTCFNPKTEDFPLESELYDDVESMIMETLLKHVEITPQDNENNSKAMQRGVE